MRSTNRIAALLLLSISTCAWSAVAVTNTGNGSSIPGAAATTGSMGTVAAGSMIVAACGTYFGTAISSVTDSAGETLALASDASGGQRGGLYYKENSGGGSSFTVTCTLVSGGEYVMVLALAASGVQAASSIDGTTTNHRTGTISPDSGTITTTGSGDLIVAFDLSGNGGTPAPSAGFTTVASDSGFTSNNIANAMAVYNSTNSAGPYDATFTVLSGGDHIVGIAAFLGASAATKIRHRVTTN